MHSFPFTAKLGFMAHVGVFSRCFFGPFFVLFFCSFLFALGCFLGAFLERFWNQNRVKMRLCDFLIFIDFH